MRRDGARPLSFPAGVVCEWSVRRARAFSMSVPAFIDISEEDQVRSRAAGAGVAGSGSPRGVKARVGAGRNGRRPRSRL